MANKNPHVVGVCIATAGIPDAHGVVMPKEELAKIAAVLGNKKVLFGEKVTDKYASMFSPEDRFAKVDIQKASHSLENITMSNDKLVAMMRFTATQYGEELANMMLNPIHAKREMPTFGIRAYTYNNLNDNTTRIECITFDWIAPPEEKQNG